MSFRIGVLLTKNTRVSAYVQEPGNEKEDWFPAYAGQAMKGCLEHDTASSPRSARVSPAEVRRVF